MSARIREALRELEQDVSGLRLSPSAEVRARGRARSRRQAAALAGVAVVAVAGGAAALPALSGPPAPGPAAGPASASATSATVDCAREVPLRVDVVLRPGASASQTGEVNYRIAAARGDRGLRCGGQTVATRPDREGRVVLSVVLAAGEDAAPIRAAVDGLPGVERVVVTGGR